MVIQRSSTTPLRGVHASTLAELEAALHGVGRPTDPTTWVVGDLSLGAWSGHLLASQVLDQLGAPAAPPAPPPRPQRGGTLDGADMIGRLVDAEAAGRTEVVRALRLAETTVHALAESTRQLVIVFAPRFGRSWREADLAYLRFVAHGLGPTDPEVILVVGDDPSPLPDELSLTWLDDRPGPRPVRAEAPPPSPASLAALIPDLLTVEVLDELQTVGDGDVPMVDLGGGRRLIDPSVRSRPTADRRPHHDRLGGLGTIDSSIRAYAHVHGTGYHCDIGLLVGEAWRQFVDGGHEIAIDLMEHVCAVVTDPASRSRLRYELQGMRIALQRFAEACEGPDPAPTDSDETRGGLLMTTGWAKVMTGEPHQARDRLAAARRLLAPSIGGTRQFLYLDNIYALSLLRSGEPDASLAVERSIEAELDRRAVVEGARDWPLTYVNSINQARLHKYRQDAATSRRYYERAFATTLGCRSESDALYTAVCLAQLHDADGRPELAYPFWLRAGLHWVAADVPEALAPRAAAAIVGSGPAASRTMVDEVSAALHREIRRTAAAAGHELVEVAGPPGFARGDRLADSPRRDRLVGDRGWTVIATKDPVTSALAGPSHERLRGLLAGAIVQASTNGGDVRGVVLPIMATTDVPHTRAEAWAAALEYAVPTIEFGGQLERLSDEAQRDLAARRLIAHGDAVDRVDGRDPDAVVVSFRRYRTPLTLTGFEAAAVLATTTPTTPAALTASVPEIDRAPLASAIDRLLGERILRTELPADVIGGVVQPATEAGALG